MSDPHAPPELHPGLTLLEVMYNWPQTQEVFARYQKVMGVCLACQELFTTLDQVAAKYHLDLPLLLAELRKVMPTRQTEED